LKTTFERLSPFLLCQSLPVWLQSLLLCVQIKIMRSC